MISSVLVVVDMSKGLSPYGELQCEDGYDSIFGNGTLRTVFVDGEACNKETFEDIRERLNGGNKKNKDK